MITIVSIGTSPGRATPVTISIAAAAISMAIGKATRLAVTLQIVLMQAPLG